VGKARRAISDDRKKAGSPPRPSKVRDSWGKSTQATTGALDHCWHIRQLQKCGRIGVPNCCSEYVPHRQPPL
jgi:hypothetical protein